MISLSLEECKEALNKIISNLVADFKYVPSPIEFMSSAHAAYFLGTRFAGFYKSGDILNDSPFNALVMYIKEKADEAENGTFRNLNLEQKFEHLSTVGKRIDVIHDICLFNENMIHYLSHEPIGIREELSNFFFNKIIKDDIEKLANHAVKDISTIFSSSPYNLESLSSLIQITYLNGTSSPEYSKVVDEVILPKIEAEFANRKVSIEDLPLAAKKLRQLFDSSKDLHFITSIRKLFLNHILRPNLDQIKAQLSSEDSIAKIISCTEVPMVEVLSLAHDDDCDRLLMSLFDSAVIKVTANFATESNVRDIAQAMLDLLTMGDRFVEGTHESRLQGEVPHALKRALAEARFHPKAGTVFAAALAFVFDSLLKRGNVFKKRVTMGDVIRLLSLVADRDVFLRHYEEHLFRRLATRASSGRELELECLAGIAGVVHEDNLAKCREILAGAVERVEEGTTDFRYMLWRAISVPDRGNDFPARLPPSYKANIETAERAMAARWPERRFVWRHALATAEGRLKTARGVSQLTLSLAQAAVLLALCEFGSITFEELFEKTQIDRGALAGAVRSLRSGKVILLSEKQIETSNISVNNSFHMARAIVADNWIAREADTKEVPRARTHALQAAAVRLMKKNRIMRTQQLIDGVVAEAAQLFPASAADVRFCLKFLETNGYIEQHGPNHYIYVE